MDEFRKDQAGEHIEENRIMPSVNIPLLAKWINVLFWLVIVVNVASLLTSENVTNAAASIAFAGQIISIAADVAYGVILLKIAYESFRYRSAAICCFITAGISAVLIPVSDGTEFALAIPVVIVTIVIDMVGEYYEIMGHSDVLCDVDKALSDKWIRLWKWYLGTFLGIIGGTVVAAIIPLIGMVIVLASTIGTFVVSVLKIIYIYKTAKAFRNLLQ